MAKELDYPPQLKEEFEGLEQFLTELFDVKPPFRISVVAYEDSPPYNGFRIFEINIFSDTDGTCFFRSGAVTDWTRRPGESPDIDGLDSLSKNFVLRSNADNLVESLILASEDFVRNFHVLESLDDAKYTLQKIVKG